VHFFTTRKGVTPFGDVHTDALKESSAHIFRVKRGIISDYGDDDDDDDEGSRFSRKRDIHITLHGVHPKKRWSLVLAVFVNGLT
jgi:hypothetical protein